ncbi:MAG TPA: aldo/keto reductase [Anaerolineales bacterium]|jgi:aryl-alcohol dehydrogenase-like predicted oxidoreductase|nr:aldo/keto reductase [Anaerolineae bacterium]HRJ58729.1 aldo/keto reductase [Anaerolineales bacterium]HRK89123.1 aldo/keto reductase [Anaerolineales bacterium]
MNYKKLGRTGVKVSALCMGTMQFGWSLGEEDSHRILTATFESGINFLDTADIYSKWVDGNPGGISETYIGNWMKANRIRRDQLVIATKVRGDMGRGPNDEGLSRAHIMSAVEASLRRLQTDYIDLYQSHWTDDDTPIEETMRAFDDLVRQGKVRYVGASNYDAWELMQSLWVSDKYNLVRYDSLQPHYNLIHREEFERELRAVCHTYGIGVIPYSPLAGGFLTGKYRQGQPLPASKRAEGRRKVMTEKNFNLLYEMERMALLHKASIAQIALAWMLADPVVTCPIIGATSVEQLNENLGALQVNLTAEERATLSTMTDWKSG